MKGNGVIRRFLAVAAVSLASAAALVPAPSHAAGAVEMQVDRIVNSAIDEYNLGMESGDPEGWLKYFSDSAKRQSPLSSQTGKADFTEHYKSEFKDFKAKWVVKKMVVMARQIAVLFDWDATHKPTDTPVKIEMVAFFDMGSSGRFDSVHFVFDPAKLAKVNGASK